MSSKSRYNKVDLADENNENDYSDDEDIVMDTREELEQSSPGEKPDYGVNPIKTTCNQCMVNVTTFVQHEMNPAFPLAAMICLCIFGYLSLIICPFAYLITQNAVHRCSRCLTTLGIKRCFGLPEDFNAQIWHLKLGKCAIVIERVWALLILAILAIGACVYVYCRPYELHHGFFDRPDLESKNITNPWVEYLDTCSGEKIIENQVHALHEFSQIYENNIIDWDGYYIDTKYKYRDFSVFGNEHYMSILVKMDPSESETFADIVLSISQEGYQNNQFTFDNLQKGDHIRFRAKIQSMGSEFKLHHLHLLNGDKDTKSIFDSGHTKDLDHIIIQESQLP